MNLERHTNIQVIKDTLTTKDTIQVLFKLYGSYQWYTINIFSDYPTDVSEVWTSNSYNLTLEDIEQADGFYILPELRD